MARKFLDDLGLIHYNNEFKEYISSNFLSSTEGGAVNGDLTTKNILPSEVFKYNIGEEVNPYLNVFSNKFALRANDSGITYGGLVASVVGTTETEGVGRLVLGNNTPLGTENNSSGSIRLYGNKTGCTNIYPSNNEDGNLYQYFPEKSGTLALDNEATTTTAGLMSATDKTTLDNIPNTYVPLEGGKLTGDLETQNISPSEVTQYNIGAEINPYLNVFAQKFALRANNSGVTYGGLTASVLGTTETEGVGRLVIGNNLPLGTDNNCSGSIRVYGNQTGATNIYPNNNTDNNVTLRLPGSSGTLALNKVATTTNDGLMSAADKSILDNVSTTYLPLSGGGTINGSISAKNITGTWLQSTANNSSSTTKPKVCVQDSEGWIYTRTLEQFANDIKEFL